MGPRSLPLVSNLLAVAVWSRLVAGRAWIGPEPTAANLAGDQAQQGFTPRPTQGPTADQLELKLLKRNVGDEVCGYESGLQANSYTCNFAKTCYFFTEAGYWGMRGCCTGSDLLNCGWAATCVDYQQYTQGCGLDCQQNDFVVKCTNIASPYCQSYLFPDVDVIDYNCGYLSESTYHTVRTAYAGQVNPYSVEVASPTFTGASLVSKPTSSEASTSTSSSRTPTPTAPTPVPVNRSSSSSTPVAIIVGAVLGGLLVLGLALGGVLVYFLLKRRRRRRAPLLAQEPPPGSTNTSYPSTAPDSSVYTPLPPQSPAMQEKPPSGIYGPVVDKVDRPQQSNTQSWYGGYQAVPQQQQQQQQQQPQQQQQQHPPPAEDVMSPTASEIGTSESLLSTHGRPSYMSVSTYDPAESHQLHSDSITGQAPPRNHSGPIYEAPGPNEARH